MAYGGFFEEDIVRGGRWKMIQKNPKRYSEEGVGVKNTSMRGKVFRGVAYR